MTVTESKDRIIYISKPTPKAMPEVKSEVLENAQAINAPTEKQESTHDEKVRENIEEVDTDKSLDETKEDDEPLSAVNPETGEINWDCPCLASALKPPCGEFFKAAFQCFVDSKTEPKGEDCLEQFIAMQDCFKSHPELYQKELDATEEANDDLSEEISEHESKEISNSSLNQNLKDEEIIEVTGRQ